MQKLYMLNKIKLLIYLKNIMVKLLPIMIK